ncbi:MAG: hypothetical protein NC244_08915 [Alistipes senegalensis]|nr:hypothetical protein [Alistipes senegalensis]
MAENLGNQATALESLLNAYEMQTAKDILKDRRTDIEDFDTHLQAISSAFLHSLEVTENTTERVKAEFQRQLDSVKKSLATATEQLTDKQSLLDEYRKMLEKAVLTANQEHTRDAQNQTKEIQRLYAEIDRLRQENLTLNTNLAMLNAEKSKKETE